GSVRRGGRDGQLAGIDRERAAIDWQYLGCAAFRDPLRAYGGSHRLGGAWAVATPYTRPGVATGGIDCRHVSGQLPQPHAWSGAAAGRNTGTAPLDPLVSGTLDRDYAGANLLFVVGCPRSGTTWIQRLLATHPCVRTGQESDLFDLYIGPQLRTWQHELETDS